MLCLYVYGEVVGVEVNIVSSRFDDINEQLGIKESVASNDYFDDQLLMIIYWLQVINKTINQQLLMFYSLYVFSSEVVHVLKQDYKMKN